MKKLTIAIDGPSGAGKGTIARTLSEHLGSPPRSSSKAASCRLTATT
jgi:cytidylate kinase